MEFTLEQLSQTTKVTPKVAPQTAPRAQVQTAIAFDSFGKRIETNVKPKTEFTNSGVTITKSRVSEESDFFG